MAVDQRLLWLDLIRGLSAVAVAAGHLRLVMMCGYGQLSEPTLPQTIFFILTGLSSQAVMVFFVLSGFLVGGSALRQGPRFQFGEYFLSRLVRLWVVLIPALIWTLAIDTITISINPDFLQSCYFPRWTSGPTPGSYSSTLPTFLGNLAFVNTIFVASYGSNGPLWSLACEFWYYMLFPLLAQGLGLIGPRPTWSRRLGYLFASIGIVAMMPKMMLGGFLVWLMGVGVAVLVQRWPQAPSPAAVFLTLLAFGLALAISKVDHYGITLPVEPRYIVGLCSAWMIFTLARVKFFPRSFRRPTVNLAEISYTFYLFHFPVTVLIGVAVYANRERQADVGDVLEFAGWMLALIALTIPFWWILERRTTDYRHHARELLSVIMPRLKPVYPEFSSNQLPRQPAHSR